MISEDATLEEIRLGLAPAIALVVIGLVVPCAGTAALTRLVLPAMTEGGRARGAAIVAVVTLLATAGFTAVVLFGAGL